MSVVFGLKCWTCGAETSVEGPELPRFGVDVLAAAEAVGWLGVVDGARGRVVVFDREACWSAATTKRGTLRLRHPSRPTNVTPSGSRSPEGTETP